MKNLVRELMQESDVVNQLVIRKKMKAKIKKLVFTTMGKAKRDTKLSYLGGVNTSAKIVKNAKMNYDTYIVYLAPYKMSGYNTCAKASQGCVEACLNTSGRVKMDTEQNIMTARMLKTIIFYENREFFNSWLFAEIESAKNKAKRNGHKFSVRLNGTSDLNTTLFSVDKVNVLDKFKDVQFYDYTKVFNRLENIKSNYHLTFSYSGENMDEVISALDKGFNVAVPFLVKKGNALPNEFLGFEVGDADETDLRFLDTLRIAGLRVKITKDKNAITTAVQKGFVIDPENFELKIKVS